jgi:hypothetical protein
MRRLRADVVLAYVAAALLTAVPWVPALEDVLLRNLSEGTLDTTLSFVEVAVGSRDVAERGPPRPWARGDEFRPWQARRGTPRPRAVAPRVFE